MSMSNFAAFARGSICSTFINSVPLVEIARATSTIQMALSVLMDRRKEWEDAFVKKFGVPVDSEVGKPKMLGAFCVMALRSLDVEGVAFVKSAPSPALAPELQGLKKLVEDQRMALEGLRNELAEVWAKSQAAAKRKMARVPPLSRAELLKVRERDVKPQWVYASLLALSTLLWRGEVPTHEFVSPFGDKDEFTDFTLDDLAPVMDSDATNNEVWCLESMNDDEMDRLKAFVLAVWTFAVTSLSAYRGKMGLDSKAAVDQREAEDDEPSLLARLHGCTGAAEEEVVARRLAAMMAKFRIEGDRTLSTAKPGAESMDVTSAPVTACRAYINAGRGVKHHCFHECPAFD